MKRRILSAIVALCLIAALLPMSILAASYTDTDGHWAEKSIERWSAAGIVQGTGDAFAPDSDLTCAQLATILAKLLRLPAADDAGFTDNAADAWYYDAINRCAAAGILTGYADGTVRPNESISRARAMVMLARALGIETTGTSVLNGYADSASVPDWARGYVAALLRADIVAGVSGSRLAPLANITRAQFVTILDRAIAIYADEDGATVKADDVDGLIVVVAEDVTVKDAPAGTKVVASATAKGLKVNGKSVSANEIHTVLETVERPKSAGHAHTHEYKYIDNGDGTHTGVCTANDSTLEPADHVIENGKCTICGAEQTAESVASVLGEDGTYTYCDTLAAALKAVADGGTVKLVDDVENPGNLTVTDKKVTLDMTGHTITSNDKQVFNVSGTGDLTITGNGTIAGPIDNTAKELDGKAMLMVSGESAKLTVLDGTITAGGVGDCGMYGIYVANGGNVILGDADTKTGPTITTWFAAVGENNTTSPANITIYGGEYTAQAAPSASDWWAYFCAPVYASASGDINISGGTFNGYYGISSRYSNVGQNLNISGGTFNGTNAALFVDTKTGTACEETRTIALTGGTYSSDPSTFLAPGAAAYECGENKWTVLGPVSSATAEGKNRNPDRNLYMNAVHSTYTYSISTVDELKVFAGIVTNTANVFPHEITYIANLNSDIDMSGIEWTPVPMLAKNCVYVTLNGAGHTIKNLNVSGAENVALFTAVGCESAGSAEIKNLTISDSNFEATGESAKAGTFMAKTGGYCNLTNCHVVNCTVKSAKYGGGFFGYDSCGNAYTLADCSVENTSVTSTASEGSSASMGGFIGYTQTPHTLTECSVNGNSVTGKYAGAYYGTYNGSCNFNSCKVNDADLNVTNFFGRNPNNYDITINDTKQ